MTPLSKQMPEEAWGDVLFALLNSHGQDSSSWAPLYPTETGESGAGTTGHPKGCPYISPAERNGHSPLIRERMKKAALPSTKTAKAKSSDFLAVVPNT